MNTSIFMFVWIPVLGVLMSPVVSQEDENIITVCQEEDHDLRVDCHLEPKANYHTDFEFSMSKSHKETIINTNISGIMPEPKFRHNTFVTELEPYGFRLTMMGFTITENTTFICKVSKTQKTLFIELGKAAELSSEVIQRDLMAIYSVEPCSAISVFLLGHPWGSLVLPLCLIQMWEFP